MKSRAGSKATYNLPEEPSDNATEMVRRHVAKNPDVDAGALEVSIRVRSASARVTAAFSRWLATNSAPTQSRFPVLLNLHLASDGRLTQLELGRRIQVTPGTVTYIIDGLEKDGLVVRSVNPADRRVTYVELTPEGEALCAELVPAAERFTAELCKEFAAEDVALLNRLLTRLQSAADGLYPDE